MKYNLADKVQLKAARNRVTYLASKGRLIDLKDVRPTRTLRQNAYLHLLIGAFGLHFGYTIEEAKWLYKQLNSELYFYQKNDHKFPRSSADLDTKEMTESIDRFREWSDKHGCYLPPATNFEELISIENEMEKNRRFLS